MARSLPVVVRLGRLGCGEAELVPPLELLREEPRARGEPAGDGDPEEDEHARGSAVARRPEPGALGRADRPRLDRLAGEEAPEVEGDGRGARVAALGLLSEASESDRLEVGMDLSAAWTSGLPRRD